MVWILVAWGAAVLFAAIVLGFGAYELRWKRARLHRDLAVLQGDLRQLERLQTQLKTAAHLRPAESGA